VILVASTIIVEPLETVTKRSRRY